MDLETRLTDAYTYTTREIEKNLALAEVHAKQFSTDPFFCLDCLRKHFILIEGLADEGINFTDSSSEKIKFQRISQTMKIFQSKLHNLDMDMAHELSDKLRIIRKALHSSPIILGTIGSNPIDKDLNSPNPNNILKENQNRGIKMEIKQIGIVTGSQFVARAVQEAEAYVPGEVVPGVTYKTVINLVGGVGAILATFWKGTPEGIKLPLAVIGSKILADEVVDLAKKQMTPIQYRRTIGPSLVVGTPQTIRVGGNELVRVD